MLALNSKSQPLRVLIIITQCGCDLCEGYIHLFELFLTDANFELYSVQLWNFVSRCVVTLNEQFKQLSNCN